MDEYTNIRAAIEPAVSELGFEIVRLKWIGDTLQLMMDQHNGAIITVEDCVKVSHTVSALLDVEDIIQKDYRLEVSSPGIDRPLTRMKDFEEYKGFEAKLETKEPVQGRKKFRGKVISLDDEKIDFEIRDEKTVYQIPFSKIAEVKLVMTNELVDYVSKKN